MTVFSDIYTLDIPNNGDFGIGLMRNLIPSYITNDTLTTTTIGCRPGTCFISWRHGCCFAFITEISFYDSLL